MAEGCARHGRRRAVATCVSCGTGMCTDCVTSTSVGFKCPDCSTGPRAASPGRSRVRMGAVLVLLAALVAGGIVLLGGGSGELTDGSSDRIAIPTGDGLELVGAVDTPEGDGPHPGVLIISGFGAATRIGLGAGTGTADPLYRDLGRRLADAGMVVLRYDKRGVGGSRPLPESHTLTFGDRVADAEAALAVLRTRADVDADRVAIVGHGEGALVATLMTGGAQPPTGLVMINPWGRPLVDVLATEFVRDLPAGESLEAHRALADELRTAVSTLRETGTVPDRGSLPDILRPIFTAEMDVYLHRLFGIDPADPAAAVEARTLLVHGERDPCVTREGDIDRLAAVMSAAHVEVLSAPAAGHTLRPESTPGDGEHPGVADMTVTGRDDGAMTGISEWLAATLGIAA